MEVVKEESEQINCILTAKKEDKRTQDIKIELQLSVDDNNQELSNTDSEELQLSDDDNSHELSADEIGQHVCEKCFKPFRRIMSLQKHLDYCRFNSNYHIRKAEMLKNLEKIEKDSIIMEQKDVCSCCGESYDTCHVGHITCPDCPKTFKTQISYERHVFLIHSEFDDYPCSICNAKLRSANLLKLHEQQHRIRGRPFACKLCGKDFARPYNLVSHQKYSSCATSICNTFSCKVCSRVFKRIDHLKNHLRRHLDTEFRNSEKKYACTMCDKCFNFPSTLNIHLRTHTGERPFDCDLCEKKFPSLVALKSHRRSHTSERPYICLVCKGSFSTNDILKRHMKRHTGERPHACSECDKSFITTVELRSHIKTHFRPYECNRCHEKFRTEKQLARHVKGHYIVKRKSNKVQKRKHRQKIHATPAKRPRRKTRTDCPVCKIKFDTAQTLQFHILKVHQEDPEAIVNENSCHSKEKVKNTDIHLTPSPNVNKIENSQSERIEFVNNNNDEILNTNIQSLKQQTILKTTNNMAKEQNEYKTLEDKNQLISAEVSKQTVFLPDDIAVTSLKAGVDINDQITTRTLSIIPTSPDSSKKRKKALAKSLAAAIADDDDINESEKKEQSFSEENLKIKDNVSKLLNMLVDSVTLKKFGWPRVTEEIVLCKVIQNCGHDLSKDQQSYSKYDYANRMREYVKLLFTVVIHDESIKELLDNYPIDEVIQCVLDNDGDENDYDDYKDKDKTIKHERTYS